MVAAVLALSLHARHHTSKRCSEGSVSAVVRTGAGEVVLGRRMAPSSVTRKPKQTVARFTVFNSMKTRRKEN